MPKEYFYELLKAKIDAGESPQEYWWDESRIPLASIDKRVSELLDLSGKRAIVTGGAGINLGQACVNRLAGLGAEVAVVDLAPKLAQDTGRMRWANPPDAEAVAKAAAEKWGTKVVAVHGDVTEWDGVQKVFADCVDQLGGVDILVNNACDTVIGDFTTFDGPAIDRSVRGTLSGPMYCSRVALDYMLPRGEGVIINIGSEASGSAMPWLTVYGSLKAGLATFTKFLGKEVARDGIRVLGVNAGSMWGPNRPLGQETPQTLYARARSGIQRFELPEEVANMVAFLASDASSAMAGVMIDMGGGLAL